MGSTFKPWKAGISMPEATGRTPTGDDGEAGDVGPCPISGKNGSGRGGPRPCPVARVAPMPTLHPVAAALAALLVPAALVLSAWHAGGPEPSPDLAPAEVVRIQVEALQHNDDPHPDAGIATTFRFASPANQIATGPLGRFAQMVKGPIYGDLLDFAQADFGRIAVDGDRAAQRVTLTHDDGRRAVYVFALSRQDGGPFDGCWMTDGVARRPLPEAATTRI